MSKITERDVQKTIDRALELRDGTSGFVSHVQDMSDIISDLCTALTRVKKERNQFEGWMHNYIDSKTSMMAQAHRILALEDNQDRLIQHCAVLGLEIRGDVSNWANESWRSLPEDLTTAIELIETQLLEEHDLS
jgi:hypothetical protein